jgi:hypothetical protein
MQESFRHLIEGFCKFCGLDDPGRILDGGAITVNDVVFSLIHSEKVNPDLLFIYCDFGDVPVGRQAEAYRMLLEANLFLYTGNGPTFTISGESKRVIFADQYRLDQKSDPEELHSIMVAIAAKAVAWRVDHFLPTHPQNRARLPSSRLPGASR